jgi:hypothetical protein
MKSIFDNFITIQGWMVEALKLKGSDLQLFALVHGFCQDGKSRFSGSISYIETWLNASRPTAIAALNRLTSAGWIVKHAGGVNETNEYSVNWKAVNKAKEVVKKLDHQAETGSKESLPEVVKKFNGGSKESLPNIYSNTDNENIESAPAQIEPQETPQLAARPGTTIADIQSNPNAAKDAAQFLKAKVKEQGDTSFPAQYAEVYFLNEAKKGNWYSLAVPTTMPEIYAWIGKHGSGVRLWAMREVQFNNKSNGYQQAAPAVPTHITREL